MEQNKIVEINYKQLRNEDVYTCMESIKEVVDGASDLSAMQVDVYNFNDAFDRYKFVLEPIRQRQLTPMLKTMDRERDTSYSGMHSVVLGFKDSPISEEKEAATLLNNVFVQYKGIQRLSNKTETGRLRNFFEELDGPYHEHLETLHLTAWFEVLKQMNEDFDDLYNHRRITNDALVNSEEITAARNALVSAFRNLAADLETLLRIGDDHEGYLQVLSDINSILSDWKRTLNLRKGQKNAKNNQQENGGETNNGSENTGEDNGDENDGEENGSENTNTDNTDPNQGDDNTPSANA